MKKECLYMLLLLGCSLSNIEGKIPVIGSALNELEGFFGHHAFSYSNTPLKPEHEAFVRSVAEQMGMTEKFSVYSTPYAGFNRGIGPHCRGNRVYFDDAWFEAHKNFPDLMRFVVGHELSHVERQHSPKKHIASLVTLTFSPTILLALVNRTSLPRLVAEKVAPDSRNNAMVILGYVSQLVAVTAGALIYYKLSRMQEYEADRYSVQKLSAAYGRKKIVEGAAHFFTSETDFSPESFISRCVSTHPTSRERLLALSFPESASKQAGEHLKFLYRKHCLQMFCSIFGYFDEHEYDVRWKEIWTTTQLLSVHASIAREYASALKTQILRSFTLLEECLSSGKISQALANEYEPKECAVLKEHLQRTQSKSFREKHYELVQRLLQALLADFSILEKIMLQ